VKFKGLYLAEIFAKHDGCKEAVGNESELEWDSEWRVDSRLKAQLTVPRGATTEAGAKAYEMKFPNSPKFMRRNPSHLT
jgi:hypothetical protein